MDRGTICYTTVVGGLGHEQGTHTVLVDVTAAAVAELGVTPGEHVWLTAKATDVSAYPAPVAT